MIINENILRQLKLLPKQAGVYKFFNNKKKLIYVGKAKNLKSRVSSYFNKPTGLSLKTRKLASEIDKIDFIIVNTEFDALLLENNLIKENQPKYNILLKDDKSFPFICISNERFPKIYSTRQQDNKAGEYFGPYTNIKALNNIIELIRKLYKVRTCSLNLSEKNIKEHKFKICLEYHIKNCLGPCEGLQSEESYLLEIQQARNILKGQLQLVKKYFEHQMSQAAIQMQFEVAQEFKDKLELLDKFQSKTIIVNSNIEDLDVISISSNDESAFINYLKLENGMINISESFTIVKKLDETDEEILETVLTHTRKQFSSNSKLILCNKPFEVWDENIQIKVPQIGDKKAILDLSMKNVLIHKKNSLNQNEEKRSSSERILQQLKDDLKLQVFPTHIECFDNSNIQGTNPVASMVCFKNGKPSKKDYRHFKIKTVIGPDDFASMNEIVTRRYSRLKEENLPYPNLIIIDGGKGQLSAACDALKALNLYNQIPVIGIAKRLEEIYYPEDSVPIHISKKSESLKLIQQLRNEAHRFAITFHRDLRSKGQIVSELDSIVGIGSKTKQMLLSHFKSLEKLKQAKHAEIEKIIGAKKTEQLLAQIKRGVT